MNPLARLLDPTLAAALSRLVARGRHGTALGAEAGPRRSVFKGQSVAFRQHRPYVPGDDTRRLDWRVLARTDHAFVREYDDERAVRTVLVLDASGSMAYAGPATRPPSTPSRPAGDQTASKFDAAARLAAALAFVALAGDERAGLVVAGGRSPGPVTAAPAAAQLGPILRTLEQTAPAGATALAATLAVPLPHAGRRAVVVILSDGLLPPADLRRGLARLQHARHDVTFVRLVHPDELDFPFRGWVRFAGLEGESGPAGNVAAMRRAYLDRAARHTAALRDACRRGRATFVEHVVGRPLLDTVRAVVRRGRR